MRGRWEAQSDGPVDDRAGSFGFARDEPSEVVGRHPQSFDAMEGAPSLRSEDVIAAERLFPSSRTMSGDVPARTQAPYQIGKS